MPTPNLANVPEADLHALASGDMSQVSEPTLRYLSGQPQQPVAVSPEPSPLGIAARTVGENALALPEAAGTALLNTPHAVAAAAYDLSRRILGQSNSPEPGWVHDLGQDFTFGAPKPVQDLVGAVNNSPIGRAVDGGAAVLEGKVDPWLQQHPTTNDVLHQTGGVANDVLNLTGIGEPAAVGLDALSNSRRAIMAALEQYKNAPLRDTPEDMDAMLRAVGFQRLPSKDPNAGLLRRGAANMVGEDTLAGRQTLTDQQVANTLAGHAAGVPYGQPVTDSTLVQAAQNGPARVYNAAEAALPPQLTMDDELRGAIAGIGNTASQLPGVKDVDDIKQFMLDQPQMSSRQLFANVQDARYRAARYLASEDPKVQDVGDAYKALANAYEDFIGRQLDQPGSPVSLQDFQNARVQFAKNYAVRAALRTPDATDVDMGRIARQAARNPGELTGELRLIAAQHGRAPLSSGYGPTTLPGGGIGRSGSTGGIVARGVLGSLGAGAAGVAGMHFFGYPGMTAGFGGYEGGLALADALMNRTRAFLASNPQAAGAMARAALEDPRFSAFLGDPGAGDLPSGWNRTPQGVRGLLAAPSAVNAGGGATTPSMLAELGLTPDVMAAGAAHPGAPAVRPATPSPLGDELTAPGEMPEVDATALRRGPAHTELHPPAQITLATGSPGGSRAPSDGIPLADLLSHGVEQPPSGGLTLGPMGDPGGGGVPFHVDPGFASGDLSLADDDGRPLGDLVADLHDYANVMSQGVPEGIVQRSASAYTPRGDDTASLKDASPEAINRTAQEKAQGNPPFFVSPDGIGTPLLHDTHSVDASAPKGHLKVQVDPSDGQLKILDRGGLSETAAKGLLNRFLLMQQMFDPGKW